MREDDVRTAGVLVALGLDLKVKHYQNNLSSDQHSLCEVETNDSGR